MTVSRILYRIWKWVLLTTVAASCEDFVQLDLPDSQLSAKVVFENDETAIAAATGMYNVLLDPRGLIGELNPLSYTCGLLSEELLDRTGKPEYVEFNTNDLTASNSIVLGIWSNAYRTIYEANAVIEGAHNSSGISSEVRQQLLGEAKFVRAFCYFYLVNLFGDVALTTTTDYRSNAQLKRTLVSGIYGQIESDLVDASELLSEEYSSLGKVRPNKHAATALLARVYLYLEEYEKAQSAADQVIESGLYQLSENLNNVFLANSSESILELSQVYPYIYPTADGTFFILSGFKGEIALRSEFLNSFQPNDQRLSTWVSSFDGVNFYPYKYKVFLVLDEPNFPENLVLLRLAELYLIRAEARTELGDEEGAKSDLNLIRHRAGLPDTDANDATALKTAIENERRFEFFCEMGHRWLDLKRMGRATAVLGALKPQWKPSDVLLPIPEKEMLSNPNLIPQNEGY